jgi:putative ABC transport system permease protein
MLPHNVFIAWRSLRRNPMLSALIVGAIALGIGVATTFATVRHAFTRDPLPEKSHKLFYVRLDSWDPAAPHPNDTGLPNQITYRDMVEIMKSTIPARQTGSFKSSLYVYPDAKVGRPFKELTRLVFADFFPMFQVPFKYGGPWDRKADAGPESVVVLSEEMNAKLFGGENSVGRTVRLEDRDFKVVGVLDAWDPGLKFYDLTQGWVAPPEQIYMPFNQVRPMQLRTAGNSDGWGPSVGGGFEGNFVSEGVWIQMWVELPDAAAREAYLSFLNAYALEQKKHGRFQRPLNNRVDDLVSYMKIEKVIPPQTTVLLIVSLLFLAVCAVNLIGILLGKFLSRAPEVGVRRALGASRLDVFLQHLVECELIGVLGGVIGLLLSLLGIAFMNVFIKDMATRGTDLFRLDVPMVALSTLLALAAGLVAGLYPAWRICQIPPALYLKQ